MRKTRSPTLIKHIMFLESRRESKMSSSLRKGTCISRSMIQALTREHEELKKNLKLASSNQNELKVTYF